MKIIPLGKYDLFNIGDSPPSWEEENPGELAVVVDKWKSKDNYFIRLETFKKHKFRKLNRLHIWMVKYLARMR